MQAVIPAAGEGTRLRPLTAERPKGLIEIAGRPILTHCFETLLDIDVSEFVVVIGYEGQQIVDRYGRAYADVPITYVEQEEQLGLGHAVHRTAPHVNGDFLVLNGDNVFATDIDPLIGRASRPEADGAMLVEKTTRDVARTTGVVVTDGRRVTDLVEKPQNPPSTLISAGCWVLPPATFQALDRIRSSDRGEYELTDAVARLVADGRRIETVRLEGKRVNVNTETDVERAERMLESA